MNNENSGVDDDSTAKPSFYEVHKTHIIIGVVLGLVGIAGLVLYRRK